MSYKWAVGVTTVDQRLENGLLERTLRSIARAGFDGVRLFVDGPKDQNAYRKFGLDITTRMPSIGAYGNWILGLWELYTRFPESDLYAMFQDDIVCVRNIRYYIDKHRIPSGYLNLFTTPNRGMEAGNHDIAISNGNKIGWFTASQDGFGALGLVLPKSAVQELLRSPKTVNKPTLSDEPATKSFPNKNIDGLVAGVLCMTRGGKFPEICHNPSLIQHTGVKSTLGHGAQPLAVSFPGEDFDAMSLSPTELHHHLTEPRKNYAPPPVRPRATLQTVPPRPKAVISGPLRPPDLPKGWEPQPTTYTQQWEQPQPATYTQPEIKTNITLAKGAEEFIGLWNLYEKNGRIGKTIVLNEDGTARRGPIISMWGQWELKNGVAKIEWNDGVKDSLTLVDGGCIDLTFSKGQEWESAPASSCLGKKK